MQNHNRHVVHHDKCRCSNSRLRGWMWQIWLWECSCWFLVWVGVMCFDYSHGPINALYAARLICTASAVFPIISSRVRKCRSSKTTPCIVQSSNGIRTICSIWSAVSFLFMGIPYRSGWIVSDDLTWELYSLNRHHVNRVMNWPVQNSHLGEEFSLSRKRTKLTQSDCHSIVKMRLRQFFGKGVSKLVLPSESILCLSCFATSHSYSPICQNDSLVRSTTADVAECTFVDPMPTWQSSIRWQYWPVKVSSIRYRLYHIYLDWSIRRSDRIDCHFGRSSFGFLDLVC